jgi:N-acetylglutamate synthase-like GNAT family acetyltransferase
MSSSSYRVRRATLDDVSQLVALWGSMHFPVDDLARRITEFQVAEGPDGKVVGAVGLQMVQKQVCIHSEAYTDFALADSLRPLLWDRLHSVASNHGMVRLWTQEQAPFWKQCGLATPDAEALEKLPAAWRGGTRSWLTLKLREDIEEVISADHEFKLFMESERQRTERAFQQARLLKLVATVIAVMLFVLVLAGAFLLLRRNPGFLRH